MKICHFSLEWTRELSFSRHFQCKLIVSVTISDIETHLETSSFTTLVTPKTLNVNLRSQIAEDYLPVQQTKFQ